MDKGESRRQPETTPDTNRVVTGTGDPSAATSVPTTPPGGLPRQSESPAAEQSPVEQGKQMAGEVAQQAQEKAVQVVGQVQQQAKPQLEGQKERAAQQLGTMAQALRQTGQQLRQENQGAIGQYAERGAEQIERLSGYLQERDLNQLIGDVEQFARRQPALFFGGAFALGLFGARFLKSSRQQQQ